MKQLQPHPWDAVAGKYNVGERVRGTVTRVAEFGAFVELEPGIEGLIHVSEMSWGKKMRSASTLVKPGEAVEAVILGSQRWRASHLAWTEAGAGGSLGRGGADVSPQAR